MSLPVPVIIQSEDDCSSEGQDRVTSSSVSSSNCGSSIISLNSVSNSNLEENKLSSSTMSLISSLSSNGISTVTSICVPAIDEPESLAFSSLKSVPPPVSKSLLGADLFQQPSSLAMPPPSLNKVKKARNLVNPGMSMVKWMKLQESRDKPQTKKRIALSEIARHNRESDCWMVIRNCVYDVTEYIPYHPGGIPELMKGAGKDATALFNEIHRWVNFDSILRTCLLGYLAGLDDVESALVPSLSTAVTSAFPLPRTTFSQNDSLIIFQVETANVNEEDELSEENWCVSILNRERFLLKVILKPPELWMAHVKLVQRLTDDALAVNFQNSCRRAIVTLRKPTNGTWNNLGLPLRNNNSLVDSREAQMDDFSKGEIVSIENITDDVVLLGIQPVSSTILGVPVGFHLIIRPHPPSDMVIARKYTPVCKSVYSETTSDLTKKTEHENNKTLYFIIKIYPDGQLTKILGSLQVNSSVELGNVAGRYDHSFLRDCNTLALFAGGSGITPFVRIVEFLRRRKETYPISRIILIFFNHSEKDIIWRDQWTNLASAWNTFSFFPVISSSDGSWNGLTGRVTNESLFESIILQAVSKENKTGISAVNSSKAVGRFKAMICGSAGFNDACVTMLKSQSIAEIDTVEEDLFIF